MADTSARELLRGERCAFEQAHRHGEAWFRLKLRMSYAALAAMIAVLAAALWVVFHPADYGAVPISLASATMGGQVLTLGFGVIRLVLAREVGGSAAAHGARRRMDR